ncbi:uncharacterized protein BO88DRAFT_84145 [Aspergillus vadensis CBS 113365]|uniref:Uncharacterized protein n=1 Tax=Aspergillus vadensis (strain CBS 113365 / IMI 142717 / IBT 24658) TaxID=1448311 RepID=A0A319B5Q1_ASPVC|nr:hypothetical protein BO88DRAFT_84145 [Aspergillus vadensis CBS 113365]PYH67134.1 hypothetical protein BO88DRAFT_84145 [Aspergillus vadensis CBS 113365]
MQFSHRRGQASNFSTSTSNRVTPGRPLAATTIPPLILRTVIIKSGLPPALVKVILKCSESQHACKTRHLSLRATDPMCGRGIHRYVSASLSGPMAGRSTWTITGLVISRPSVGWEFNPLWSSATLLHKQFSTGTSGAPPQQMPRAG